MSLAQVLAARFDHVAIAGPRIRDLLPLYQDLLGGRCLRGGDNVRVGYRAAQFALSDGSRVELLEPLRGSTFLDRFLVRTAGGGVHHLTFAVEDIRAAVEVATGLGYSPVHLAVTGVSRPEVFLHPKEANGVLIQIIQPVVRVAEPIQLEEILAGRGVHGTGEPSP